MARAVIETLSDEEIGQLATAAIQGSGRPLTIDEVKRAVDWAHETRIAAALLTGVLQRRLQITVPEDGGELIFRAVE